MFARNPGSYAPRIIVSSEKCSIMKSAREIVMDLWKAMEARDWSTLESLLAPSFESVFPQSGERFDRAGYLRLNREYPGDWHIQMTSIIENSECVVTEIDVEIDGRTDRAISFFYVHEGKIATLREYWPEPFAIPQWRQGWALPTS